MASHSPPSSMSSGEASYRTPAATPQPEPVQLRVVCSPPASQDACVPAEPPKRGRRSNRKVKTGCANCKHRRIKCDERRPSCSQCLKSNKVCVGYPAPVRVAGSTVDVRIAPKPLASSEVDRQPRLLSSAALPLPPGATGMLLRGHTVILPPRRAPRRRRHPHPHPHHHHHHHHHHQQAACLLYQPSQALALQHTEALYFELFRMQTASELSGYFDSSFWSQSVLQECHREPAIRHAVVALGALYKTLEQSCQPDGASTPPLLGGTSRMDSVMCHWQVAVRQYSEACNSIIYLKEGTSANNRTLLMASVLLTCFDSFIGDHKQAIRQIQTGLGLLDRIQADARHAHTQSPASQQVEEDLLVIFTRLAIQAKSYDMAFHFPHPYVIHLGPEGRRDPSSPVSLRSSPSPGPSRIPDRFHSLLDARLASDKLCEMLLRCIEHLQFAKAEPTYTLPTAWLQYAATFQSQLDAWSRAFHPIFSARCSPGVAPIESSGIAALKMFQINTNILFSMMFFSSEAQFDDYLAEFQHIVLLGREVIGHDALSHPSAPSFSADLGIVPPLFVVATKCRHRDTRRQAIRLLRTSARREGMWDSEMSARIGEWIMTMEELPHHNYAHSSIVEQGKQGPERCIPEGRRVMVQAVDFDLKARFADITAGSRDIRLGSDDRRKRVARIQW